MDAQTDSHRDKDTRAALAPLAAAAERSGFAVLGCCTPTMSTPRPSACVCPGSIAFRAAARASLVFGLHPDDPDDPEGAKGPSRVLAPSKNNNAPRADSHRVKIETASVEAADGKSYDFSAALQASDLLKAYDFSAALRASDLLKGYDFSAALKASDVLKGYDFSAVVNAAELLKGAKLAGLSDAAWRSAGPSKSLMWHFSGRIYAERSEDWQELLRDALTVRRGDLGSFVHDVAASSPAAGAELRAISNWLRGDAPPSVVADWLLWLSVPYQRRVLLLTLAAFYALAMYVCDRADAELPGDLATLIPFLLAIATLLSEGLDRPSDE